MNDFLQLALVIATITLLGTCLTLHKVPWYVQYSLYFLAASCLIGFGTARFAPTLFGWSAGGIAIMLAITGGVMTAENYRQPLTADDRNAINQRIVRWIVPVLAVILVLWYFDKRTATYVQQAVVSVDQKVNTVIQTNQKLEKTVKSLSHADSVRAGQLLESQDRLNEKATDNNILLQKVQLNQQTEALKKK